MKYKGLKNDENNMINFLNLITDIMTIYEKTPEDVDFVTMKLGDETIWFTWDDFVAKAKNLNYFEEEYADYINPSLKIVGKGCWWIELSDELFGFWEMKTKPEKPHKYQKPSTLRNDILYGGNV